MRFSWFFRHATSYFVREYGYDASMPMGFFNRFVDRYTVSETITNEYLTSVLEIRSALPGDRGWYSCKDVGKKINSTTYVEFEYDTCRGNGVYSAEFGCIEFISEEECRNNDGSLAIIHSRRKDKWIFDLAFHLDQSVTDELKLGLTLSANTMLWKDFKWKDGSSLTFVEWFGFGRSASSCKRCLEEDVPLSLGIKFHMDAPRVWQWTNNQDVVCEWPTPRNLTGVKIVPANTTYKGDKELFRCRESREYISTEFVCDTVRDCLDRSDEENCGPECSGRSFQCNCGGCISASNVCDFYKDCGDGSDEDNCCTYLPYTNSILNPVQTVTGNVIPNNAFRRMTYVMAR
ncbi:Low-density lipoprotein receptor [Mizuhopecten yessoensis]|uniref:Low-density lipoprotein receptor n=1 Tax=Mizuhopecten yessoensis TaxID=6573 RepID=A0A210QKI5_MIZYE|nr:Low-density lipoprotein receptor [Mizuhopecten yessoensis]